MGFVSNVIFPCATLHDAKTGRIAIYYGAADTYVALAFTTVEEIIEYVKETHESVGDDQQLGLI
jgi:beta-1,4-mannooligosaccharide/beta-1,4-mannosyl-N-acetylglucosamine phosphorylase